MSRTIPIQTLAVFVVVGLITCFIIRPGEVSHAQTGQFDRTQYANDKPVGELEGGQVDLPETGEFNVMIELFDLPTTRVYAQALGNQSDRAANPQQRAAAQGAARAQMVRIRGAQQRVLAHLGNFGQSAKVLYRVQTAYNGIAALIDVRILPQLRGHADVKAVHALPIHTIENSTPRTTICLPALTVRARGLALLERAPAASIFRTPVTLMSLSTTMMLRAA